MRSWLVVASLVVVACRERPPEPIVMEEAEPAWAADYGAATTAACACTDDPCIRRERAGAEAILEAHGGIEEAPPSVHEGRARLEVCWPEISHDLARDLDLAATEICECHDSFCAEAYGDHLDRLTEKYGVVTRDALRDADEADDASRATYARASACVADRTMAVDRFLPMLRANTEALCGCQTEECSKQAIAALDDIYAKYYWIDGHDDEIDELDARYCKCLSDALRRGFDVQLTKSITAHVSVTSTCD